MLGAWKLDLAVLTGRLSDDTELTVLYSIIDDDALDGQDYTTVASTVTLTRAGLDPNAFTPAQLSLSIPIIDDDLYERHPQRTVPDSDRFGTAVVEPNQERFVVRIEGVESPIRKLEIDPAATEVLIVDDEGPGDLEIRLLPENIRVIENAGTDMTLRATIPFPLDVDLELTLATLPRHGRHGERWISRTYRIVTRPPLLYRRVTLSVVIGATVSDDIITEFNKVLLVGVTHLNHAGRAQSYEYPLARQAQRGGNDCGR